MTWHLLAAPYGRPPDAPATVALVVAGMIAVAGPVLFAYLARARRAYVLGGLSLVAAALSIGYVCYYLRGGSRIIDATSYWLQARALAHGEVTWPVAEPTAAERGRFLLMSGAEGARRLGVIFPPGYSAILAIGFLLGAPLWVGPVLAGLLVPATYALARRVGAREDVARLAACLSVVSATLRYHTADTMSHGWAALLATTTLACALEARASAAVAPALLGGVGFGWLVATRPMTAIVVVVLLAFLVRRTCGRALFLFSVGVSGPLLLLLIQQRLVTGAWFLPSQSAYYAVSDGPPGCFRLAFGSTIGCLHEHGGYVHALFPNGFGPYGALINTVRRLGMHAVDVANTEPLALLVPLAAWHWRRDRRVLWLAASVPLIMMAYALFYFDGSYPGAGARLYADVLPVEHVLAAFGAVGLAEALSAAGCSWMTPARAAAYVLALALAGFGTHGAYLHRQLAERDGGRPAFEPSALAEAKVDHGLLFVSSDAEFNLAFDPSAFDPMRHVVVAREQDDDRDRIVWERWGRPDTYRYRFRAHDALRPSGVLPWEPPPFSPPYRFEAEAEWPPLQQTKGHVEPVHATGTCASGGRVLTARPARGEWMSAVVSFPVPHEGRYRVGVHVASVGTIAARVALLDSSGRRPSATWNLTSSHSDFSCDSLDVQEADLSDHGELTLEVRGDTFSLDAITLDPIETSGVR